MRRDFVMRHYAQVLMGLCETTALERVRVADVVAASGMSKPTFYSHFPNLGALVGFTASRSYLDTDAPLFSLANIVGSYRYAREHPAFFLQLPAQSQNSSFKEATRLWVCRKGVERFAGADLPPVLRVRRTVQVNLFVSGCCTVMEDWLAGGMAVAPEAIIAAIEPLVPEFMRLPLPAFPPIALDDYPR